MLTRTAHKATLVQTRTFVLPALTAVSSIAGYFLRDSISLADKLENNEVNQSKSLNETLLDKFNVKKPTFTRSKPLYKNHVPLYTVEKLAMFGVAAAGSFLHPERNEFIVALGEITAVQPFLSRLRKQMLEDPVGREILRERPNITSETLNLSQLGSYPENSVGRNYYNWLTREKVSPDTRVKVRFVDDEELAFVFQRYRQCHDFYHAITGLPITREGEIAVKLFEFLNMGIPFAGMGAAFSPLTLKASQRNRLLSVYYPWAVQTAARMSKNLINVYWEKILDRDVNEVRKELGIEVPPDMRELRRQERAHRRRL